MTKESKNCEKLLILSEQYFVFHDPVSKKKKKLPYIHPQ
jgi:hypothetical protein